MAPGTWSGAISGVTITRSGPAICANPDASISFKGKKYDVQAHLLDADEKLAVWPELTKVWPNYDVYTERSGRDLRVFRLDPR
jgi:hypothetical protein